MYEFLRSDPVRDEVSRVLRALEDGIWSRSFESKYMDFKEEAERRNREGSVLPSLPRNEAAAYALAGESACMANTEHGGALVVGVADDGQLIGTEMNEHWLRERIWELTERKLLVEITPVHVKGYRVLVIVAPGALEPIYWEGKVHWRVKDECLPITEQTWWAQRNQREITDWSARDSRVPAFHVSTIAVDAARELLRASGLANCIELSGVEDEILLRRLGVVTPYGMLTNAGYVLFIGRSKATLDYTFAMPGVLRSAPVRRAKQRRPLLVELREVFAAIDWAVDRTLETQGNGPPQQHSTSAQEIAAPKNSTENYGLLLQQVPPVALKEAILNAISHRDWTSSEPIVIRHSPRQAVVVSPGNLVRSTDGERTNPSPLRNPTLVRALAEMRLISHRGEGIESMYRELLKRGMPEPRIDEIDGGHVRVRLDATPQDVSWAQLLREVTPRRARRQLDVLLVLREIHERGSIDVERTATVLEKTAGDAALVLKQMELLQWNAEPLLRVADRLDTRGRRVSSWVLAPRAQQVLASRPA